MRNENGIAFINLGEEFGNIYFKYEHLRHKHNNLVSLTVGLAIIGGYILHKQSKKIEELKMRLDYYKFNNIWNRKDGETEKKE